MRGSFYLIALCFLGVFLGGCQSPEKTGNRRYPQLTPAFYHWKTRFDPTRTECQLLDSLQVRKLYVHFFDVDWDSQRKQAVPKAFVRFSQVPTQVVVPVVFITNRTLLNLRPTDLPALSINLTEAIRRIAKEQRLSFREVQIDCDWSGRTGGIYFQLLKLVQAGLKVPLSVTVRLHQVKFADQTGVPPVQRGMLMLYNVADWKHPETPNSIYDPAVVGRYLSYVSAYPLPLDVVVPTFGWTVVYRNRQFLLFLNNVGAAALRKCTYLSQQADSTRFVAKSDTSAFGFRVRRGDLFRTETVSTKELIDLKTHLMPQLTAPTITFAFYHLDSLALTTYPRDFFQKLLASPRP